MRRTFRIADGRIQEAPDADGTVVVYFAPDAEERRDLVETHHLDEHTLASSLDPDELARLEFEPGHVALIFKRPKRYTAEDHFLFRVGSMGLFLFPARLVVVLAEEASLFEGRLFQRIQSHADLVLRLVHRHTFHFEEHLKVITMCSDQIEGEINTSMENKHLLNLFTLEKSLVYYLNALASNGRLIEKLRVNAARVGFTSENTDLLDDVAIENSQAYEQAQVYSQVLSGLMDARVSIVSNNLNVLIKRLNVIMIALMLPALWVSFFSINVAIPFGESRGMFWFIVGSAAGLSAGVVVMRRLLRW